MTTYRKIHTTCTECKSNQILYDSFHDETFCNNCGLIQNRILLPTDAIQETQENEKQLRKALWHRHKSDLKRGEIKYSQK